jgi:hypothetical protein
MRRFLSFVGVLLVGCASALAGGGTNAVSGTSLVLLGQPNRGAAPAWVASTAYAQGTVVKANNTYLMAVKAGDSGTTAPMGVKEDIVDNTVVWRPCLSTARSGLFLANLGAISATFSWPTPAVANTGVILAPGEKIVYSGISDVPQTPVACVATAATVVATFEW